MMAIEELVDNYESGRITLKGREQTAKRVVIAASYPADAADIETWLTSEGIPLWGTAWSEGSDLKVRQIDIEGAGSINPESEALHKYTRAKVTLNYSTNTSGEVTLARMEMSGELLEMGRFGQFATSGNPIERPMCFPTAQGTLIVPRRYYPLDLSTIMSKLNKVNDNAWEYDGYSYPAETVFFASFGYVLLWDNEAGGPQYEIEYCFKINPQGWNKAVDGVASEAAGYIVWDVALPKRFTPVSFVGFPP
jgi:hypothetical protein